MTDRPTDSLPSELPEIAQLGDPRLRRVASSVSDPGAPDVQALVRTLLETMTAAHGVGIAAPQISVLQRLVIVASRPTLRYPHAPQMDPTPMLNPRLLARSPDTKRGWEGCLSVPGMRGIVARAVAIEVEYCDCTGTLQRQELTGFVARIFQHELDHLDGILYVDRLASTRDLYTEREYLRQLERA
ncbi:peptide deformylase [Rubidibacter lacunae KORDI 51-2]|uniref:Peptide deformylase n=1 Tax=Rubidibacter lacunae KORDI 51-2 TaxID=582515 RepID=U5DHH3_9CHRO|nr:peptide deformylase [Rubidibacter lacunae]ERN41071.1 peptide deformylase [Rubidibacter lacunae KORDI 51-2]